MKQFRLLIVAGAAAIVLGSTGFILKRQPSGGAAATMDLPDYGAVPAFVLADQSGEAYSFSKLQGIAWVAGFVFTRCAGQCPMVISRMKEAAGAVNGLQMVVISVDPKHDSPEILLAYAKDNGLNKPNWLWLTDWPSEAAPEPHCPPGAGCLTSSRRLSQEGFRLSAVDGGSEAEPITHSTRLALVDQRLRIRGYYDASDRGDLTKLKQHANLLIRQGRR